MTQTPSQSVVEAIAAKLGTEAQDLNLCIRQKDEQQQRLILGKTARGEQRDQVTEQTAKLLQQLIAQPADPAAAAESDRKKVPLLQIENNKEIIFRQERDGRISVNSLQSEQQKATESPVTPADLGGASVGEQTTPVDLVALPKTIEQLVNPTGQTPVGTESMLGDLHFTQTPQAIEVRQVAEGDEPAASPVIAQVQDGAMKLLQASPQTIAAAAQQLEGFVKTNEGAWQMQAVPIAQVSEAIHHNQPVQPESAEPSRSVHVPTAAPPSPSEPKQQTVLGLAAAQVAALPESNTKTWFQALSSDLSAATKLATQAVKTAAQTVQTEWQSDRGQAVRQGTQQFVEKQAEQAGRGLQKLGQWIESRPEAIREQRSARAALEVFQQGFARTGERLYEHQGLQVELKGLNHYVLRDAATQEELLKFKAERSPVGPPKLTITGKSASLDADRHAQIEQLRDSTHPVRGSVAAEAQHAAKSEAFATVARMVTEYHGTQDHVGKEYRIQAEDDRLTITAKDGRGVVYEQQPGQPPQSNLTQKDFNRFAESMKRIELPSRRDTIEVGA